MPLRFHAIEIKAFVPARDFDLSKQFYVDIGFTLGWSTEDLAYFSAGEPAFLLQNFFREEHAANFMMHLLVEDADAWWHRLEEAGVVERYRVHAEPPADRAWGLRDFVVVDPTGVLWRIGHNLASDKRSEASQNENPAPGNPGRG